MALIHMSAPERNHNLACRETSRKIPIRTAERGQLLDESEALAKGKNLVASGHTTYYAYRTYFRYECVRVGIPGSQDTPCKP